MLLAMALFFGVMYLYCWFPDLIEPYKEKRKAKIERQKEEIRKKRRALLQKTNKEKGKVLESRRNQIQEQLDWLQKMNLQIKERFNIEDNS
jgi:F0F1-type ATP synthase membrane subunit b/b'